MKQKNFQLWTWTCADCNNVFCGNHEFKTNRDQDKFCNLCIFPIPRKISIKCKIKKLPFKKMLAFHDYQVQFLAKHQPPPPESPEY